LPPCPPQTLEPQKTDQTQHFPTNRPTANTRRDAPAFIRTTELVPEVQTQHPPYSEPIIRSVLTKIPPRAEGLRHLAPLHTWHPPTSNPAPKPRRDVSDLIRVASAPDSSAQTWHPPTSNPTLKPRRDVSDLILVASAPDNTAQTWHPPTSNPTLKSRRDAIKRIRTSLDPSCLQTSPGETTTPPPQRWSLGQEPD
jgi:hypothetical protein